VEIGNQEQPLYQAIGEPEVFIIENDEKHWLENPETAVDYAGTDWINKIDKSMMVDELNEKYPTGETYNVLGEPTRARDIYYPEEPEPEKPYPFKGIRGLLTLKPKPSKQQIVDLGFNTIMPYSGNVDWKGDYISIPKDRPGKVILRFTGDEPDCRGKDPDRIYQEYLRMKAETPNIPVGLNLCDDIGCGKKGTSDSIKKYQEKWIEIANKVDYVSLNNYPYRTDWPDPLAKMEEFYNFWKANLTIPFIPMIQAHWITAGLTKPNPSEQVKFWFSKGITGYIVYTWKDENKGVVNMQNEWREANNWAKNNL